MTHMSPVLPTLVRAYQAAPVPAIWIALGLGLALSAQAQSRDPEAFQTEVWAVSCMACHGPDGRAEGAGRAIGGRPVNDLLGKLLDYKHGQLKGTIMHQHAKGYSDEELTRIADYFSRLK